MNTATHLIELQESITSEIIEEQHARMAESMSQKRQDADLAEQRYLKDFKAMKASGLNMSQLLSLDQDNTQDSEKELLQIQSKMNDQSREALSSQDNGLDVENTFLPDGAQMLTPSWAASFEDNDVQDSQTGALTINAQAVLSGGSCKNYRNWAKGTGSGLAGSGVGEIQSWVHFGFWFKPTQSRFYTVRPLFRYRGYVISKADDRWYNSKEARVTGTAWTNVKQYNWKGWNKTTVYDNKGQNINLNARRDIDRHTHNSFLLGAGDWAWISCVIGLHAYARGGGSYAENNFSSGNANYLCVPHCHVY